MCVSLGLLIVEMYDEGQTLRIKLTNVFRVSDRTAAIDCASNSTRPEML